MSVLILANTPEEAVRAVQQWLRERAAFEEATPMDDKGHRLLQVVRVGTLKRAADHLDDVVVLPTKE
jgi:hypothetical protein